jgi:hypothetical protein
MVRKTVAVVTLLSALSAALIYAWVEKERRLAVVEAEAARALKQLGALVMMDDRQQHVYSVDLRLAGVIDKIDAALLLLDQLPRLAVLQLSGTSVTDQQLRLIAGCRSLSLLALSQTSIGDQGLVHLTRLSRLQRLFAAETNITSGGLEQIAKLRRLEILDLSKTKIGGDLAPLADLDKVQHLLLNEVTLAAGAFETIAQMDSLRRLTIIGSRVESGVLAKLRAAKPDNLVIDQ